LISLCCKEWNYRSPDDIGPLCREFDPDEFWHIICDCIRGCLEDSGIAVGNLVGVSATGQREGVVFLDKEGREIYAGPNIDIRALTEGISIDSEFGNEIYSITGHLPSFLFVPAKLKWFEINRPEIYKKIATILAISDWITYRLCGKCVSEASAASELGLVDIQNRKWSDRLPNILALPCDIYPEIAPVGSRVGKVTHRAAAETGIMEGTPVAQGAPDAQCGLIGMGVKEKEQAGIVLGWSSPVQLVTDEPVLDPKRRTWTSCHPFTGRWILESNAGEAGSAYCWLKEIMFRREDSIEGEVYELMDNLASEVPPGAEEVLAFIGPETMNMGRLAMKFGGFLFPVPVSVTNIHRGNFVRASLENLCFAIKTNCIQLEAISGLKIESIKIGGSLTKSRCLTQSLPAVLDMPVYVSEITDVSALGAAVCAAVGAGAYTDMDDAVSAMVSQFKVIEPDQLTALEYAEYYQRWTSTSKWLEKLSEEMK
jgi:autoinducer 2 (AI-2) kinase